MNKKIAIQEGLEEIKRGLISLGYEIGGINDEDLSAILYKADGYDINYHNMIKNMVNDNTEDRQGTLLINVTGKTLDEVDYIVNHRTYSPLF